MNRTIGAVLTALGLARRGFYIPYRRASELAASGGLPQYSAIAACMQAADAIMAAHRAAIEECAVSLERLGGEPPPAPRWNQDWFPRLDAAAAYAMVRRLRPRRVVEVGSGHSTRFLARAVRDAACTTRLTAIDPAPRASLDGLEIEIIRKPVQGAGAAPFAALEANDFLVIDSSHVLMPGTDVDHLVNRVLPALPAGVLVHFHDVFLPRDYPADWSWRGYNEQLAVAALMASGAYAIEFASAYVIAKHPEWLRQGLLSRLPLVAGARESSLWLRKIR
ncbi:MAG: class I SAM-dependent methyltransferase [Betaproteobacteria bacterium]|nr:MAG: class I SAM-dependent methyltransferase [Betaproteobacteria bacterium]